jgi:molecular chaperone GrpE
MTNSKHNSAGDSAPMPDDMKDYATEPAQAQEAEGLDGISVHEAVITALESEKAELKDRLLRTLAEMENLRRRTEREVSDAKTYAVTGFARDMLAVADNLRRALESLPAGARDAFDGAAKSLAEGVDLTERDLAKTLERHGIRKLDPKGQKFDPNMHQAMFEGPDATVPKGHVTTVVQGGYAIGERVLRPAMVGVSAGPPKPAEPASDAANT